MRKLVFGSVLPVALGLLFTAGMYGQSTLTFNPGCNGNSYAGYCTSPYLFTLDGTPNVPLICDDFANEVGGTWTATDTSLSAFDGSTVQTQVRFFNAGPASTQTADYITAAVLATEIFAAYNAGDNTEGTHGGLNTADLSFAMWSLFDPNSPPVGTAADAAADLSAAQSTASGYATGQQYLNALSAADGGTVNITIYTDPHSLNGGSGNQEFIGETVPEPATWAVLGFDLVGAGLVGLYFRRRKSQARS
jgi:hypothetical protein